MLTRHLERPLFALLAFLPALALAHGIPLGLPPFVALLLAFAAMFLTPEIGRASCRERVYVLV